MPDIRSALTEALDNYEAAPAETVAQNAPAEAVINETDTGRARDESGRFVKTEAEKAAEAIQAPPQVDPAQVAEPTIQRPSTWKKEYWPLYDKLAQGQALSADEAKKLADYTNQRENEFKSGVSTYKAEADAAREIQTAMAPFMPELQRYNIKPGQWIANLGNAHRTLAMGSPQERLSMFRRLAQEYGVPVHQLAEGAQAPQVDPTLDWLTQQLTQVKTQLSESLSAQQQREQAETMAQIAAVRDEKGPSGQLLRPHFDAVKDQMSQLLSAGIATSLHDAYDKALRMNDELWQQQQAQTSKLAIQQKAAQSKQIVAAAKAGAISPKSASPISNGAASPKDRRSLLAENLESLGGGRV